jgi:hypothetical protein
MKVHVSKDQFIVAAITLLVIGAALATSAVLAQSIGPRGKGSGNTEAGLTDSQREALHASAHVRNDEYLRNFVAQHVDPHALPVVWVESWARPPVTLGAAVRSAQTVVHGKVLSVDFESNPSGGMPIATARVQVIRAIKGQASPVVSVTQLGGPVAHGQGGALAKLDADELILPGDEVVLLLTQPSAGGSLQTVQGGGVYVVRNGSIAGESSEFYKVKGLPLDQFISDLAAAA